MKERHEWKDSCIITGLPPKMLRIHIKTRFASWVILFQETFDYQNVIFICYRQQRALYLQSKAPNCQTWSIAQAITCTLMPIVKQCVLNQSQGYWLLLDALGSAFSLCIVIKVDVCKTQALNQPFLRKDFDSNIQEFKLRMMGQVLNALGPFLPFYESYIVAKAHNMLAIMLDPCFKNMKIIWDFCGGFTCPSSPSSCGQIWC